MANLADRFPRFGDHREHLQRGDDPIAGRHVIVQHDMAGLLAAQIETVLAHMFDHVAVADRRANEVELQTLKVPLETEIRHHRRHDAAAIQLTVAMPSRCDERHDLVAVQLAPLLVDGNEAIAIPIERDADVGAMFNNLLAEEFRMGRATLFIDVEAVRLNAKRHHFRAQFPKHRRRHAIGRAMGAIDDDLQPVEPQAARQCAFDEFDVTAGRILEPLGTAEPGRRGELETAVVHQVFDLRLVRVGELVAVGAKQLDTVIFERVVRRRNDDAEIGPQGPRQHGHRRCRHRADQDRIHAHRDEARGQCGFQHIAGKPGVLADDDLVPVVAAPKSLPGRHCQIQDRLRCDRIGVRFAAHTVGAEIFPAHRSLRTSRLANPVHTAFRFDTLTAGTRQMKRKARWNSLIDRHSRPAV